LLKQTIGKDYWELLYKYPIYGIGLSFSNLGNNKVYGYASSIYTCFEYTIIKFDNININTNFNLGYSYINKKFHVYNNYLNRAIGSNHNIFIRLSINTAIKINHDNRFILNWSLTHYSNGKTKSPNYGLNILTLGLGFRTSINNANIENNTYLDQLPVYKKFSHFFIFSGGRKVYDNLLNVNYKFFTASYQLNYLKTLMKQYGAGLSIFYDESIGEAIAKNSGKYDNRLNIRFRMGIYGVRSFQFKNVLFHFMLGYYVYSKYKDLTLFYSRFFLQYYLNNNIFLGIGLKAHLAKADMLEWGIGFKL